MTPVTRSATVLAGAALLAGTLTAVPAAADPSPDPVSGLVGRILGQPSGGHDRRERGDIGHTHAEDGLLRQGCHDHRYRYVVSVRSDDWSLETFLDDRTGETVASGTFSADSDPRKGPGIFRFCRYSTHAGRFTIRAKLNWYTDSGHHQAWFKPSHFRLRRP